MKLDCCQLHFAVKFNLSLVSLSEVSYKFISNFAAFSHSLSGTHQSDWLASAYVSASDEKSREGEKH